jgi:4-amino-4-deoxy-L-arabinose transferase-like glycosyltransferase
MASAGVSRPDDAHRDRWALLLVVGVAAGVILPLLGATGFFDPWETNYAEVAREMVVRDDYLYPFWKDAHFFSKPILLFWLTAPLYRLLGVTGPGPMPDGIEFVGRLPSALIGLLTVATVFLVARRFWSRRAALLSALVLSTTPYWAFLSRQAITDMPYAGLAAIGLLLLLPTALADEDERARLQALPIPRWLVGLVGVALVPQAWEIARSGAFLRRVDVLGSEWLTRVVVGVVGVAAAVAFLWVLRRRGRDPLLVGAALCFALSVLAKGPVGVGLAGIVLIVAVALQDGVGGVIRLVRRPGLGLAVAVFFAVALPWHVVMFVYDGLDESRKTWFDRYIRYDLLGRVGAGVHGDRGGLEYYVRSLSFGLLPWVGFVPLAVVDGVQRLRQPAHDREARLHHLVAVWACGVFLFFSATTTKFHHYALPFAVPAALLVGALLDRLIAEPPRAQLVVGGFAGLVGVVALRELVTSPWEWIDLFTYHYKGYKPEYYFPVETLDAIEIVPARGEHKAVTVSLFTIMPAIAGALALLLPLAFALRQWWRAGPAVLDDDGSFLGQGPGRGLVQGTLVGAVVVAVVGVQGFVARASQHWSQRWLLQTYHTLREADEPLIAYQMDWKGETFYAKNREFQVKKNVADLRLAIERPGRDFVLVQTDRLEGLKTALRGGEVRVTVVDKSNAKWLLVVVD